MSCNCHEMNRRELFEYINQVSFAVDDVKLFLDTHPENQKALEYFRKYLVQIILIALIVSRKYHNFYRSHQIFDGQERHGLVIPCIFDRLIGNHTTNDFLRSVTAPRQLHLPEKIFFFFSKTVPVYTPYFSY